jgi:2-polyprenyl-3-methyl-5-hydroxy-6-metoxy-1,4-benzoquinol methylase
MYVTERNLPMSEFSDKVKAYYESYDENGRLFKDKAHMPEYLTTVRYLDRLIKPESSVLDLCAGTGVYSFYLAEKGHKVTACDLAEYNINIIKANPHSDKLKNIAVCNALDTSLFKPDSFDIVLCMGALYHLVSDEEKTRVIRNCTAVCKSGGLIAFAYLNYFAVAAVDIMRKGMSNFKNVLNELESDSEFIFKSVTPLRIENLAEKCGLKILHNIGVDGISYMLADKINDSTDEEFDQWAEYVYKHSEETSILGYSMHGLLICENP